MVFIPVYLYIKQHSITGKLYFGKTTQNPETYLGSGLHWQRHIKKHGKEHVTTLWYDSFDNTFDLVAFALSFSQKMDIVESESWLNLKLENGLDGNPKGVNNLKGNIHSIETKLKMSNSSKGKRKSKSHIDAMRKPKSESHKLALSIAHKGKPGNMLGKTFQKVKCPHCDKIGGICNMKRYHFNNCKNLAL